MTVQKGGWDYFDEGQAGASGSQGHQALNAGEEGFASPELGRTRINNPAHCTKLASSASAQNIGGAAAVPVYIKGIYVMQALTAAATVTIGGFSTPTAAAALATTYVWTDGDHLANTEGTYPINILPGGVARAFPAGCQITCSTAGDGLKILVDWEAMP